MILLCSLPKGTGDNRNNECGWLMGAAPDRASCRKALAMTGTGAVALGLLRELEEIIIPEGAVQLEHPI